jgi:hypothetical protein
VVVDPSASDHAVAVEPRTDLVSAVPGRDAEGARARARQIVDRDTGRLAERTLKAQAIGSSPTCDR